MDATSSTSRQRRTGILLRTMPSRSGTPALRGDRRKSVLSTGCVLRIDPLAADNKILWFHDCLPQYLVVMGRARRVSRVLCQRDRETRSEYETTPNDTG